MTGGRMGGGRRRGMTPVYIGSTLKVNQLTRAATRYRNTVGEGGCVGRIHGKARFHQHRRLPREVGNSRGSAAAKGVSERAGGPRSGKRRRGAALPRAPLRDRSTCLAPPKRS